MPKKFYYGKPILGKITQVIALTRKLSDQLISTTALICKLIQKPSIRCSRLKHA